MFIDLVFVNLMAIILVCVSFLYLYYYTMNDISDKFNIKIQSMVPLLADSSTNLNALKLMQYLGIAVDEYIESVKYELYDHPSFVVWKGKIYPNNIDYKGWHSLSLSILGESFASVKYKVDTRKIFYSLLKKNYFIYLALYVSFLIVFAFTQLPVLYYSLQTRRMLKKISNKSDKCINTLKIILETSHDPEINIIVSKFIQFYEDELKMQHKMINLSNLAAMGQISSQVAHDMRSPVTVIRGYLEGDRNSGLREPAIRSINKLNRMADELLEYSKASKIELVTISLKNLIENTVRSEVQTAADKKGVKIIYNIEENATASIDAYRIGRVLTNLITNAIQAVEEKIGGVRVAIKSEDDNLKIQVSDNGSGISKECQEKIFDSFFTKNKVGGTGLGLSYCKNVIEAHGGTIEVESEVGKGTEFVITIPNCISTPHTSYHMPHAPLVSQCNPEITTSFLEPETPRNDIPASDTDILVVDDDIDMVLLWNEIIAKKYNKPALTAYSPEELMRSRMDYSRISKAIVDYQFEGSKLSGLDVVRFLKEQGVKVIHMCTGMYQDEELKSQAKELGVISIIPKPFSSDINI